MRLTKAKRLPAGPLSASIDFMDNIDGEMNRRLAVLALLYNQRRTNPYKPEVSLVEVEIAHGVSSRLFTQLTTWYLSNKNTSRRRTTQISH